MRAALRKLGELLKETPKNAGAKGVLPITGTKRVPVMDDTPTLSDLGIDKKTSSIGSSLFFAVIFRSSPYRGDGLVACASIALEPRNGEGASVVLA
jgi:hypothetical protein